METKKYLLEETLYHLQIANRYTTFLQVNIPVSRSTKALHFTLDKVSEYLYDPIKIIPIMDGFDQRKLDLDFKKKSISLYFKEITNNLEKAFAVFKQYPPNGAIENAYFGRVLSDIKLALIQIEDHNSVQFENEKEEAPSLIDKIKKEIK